MRKRAQKKVVRTRIDGTVASSPLFVPYGAPGVDEERIDKYENNQRDLLYAEGTGQDRGPSVTHTGDFAGKSPGFNVGYYSEADIDGRRTGRGQDSASPAAAYFNADGSELRGGGGAGFGADGRPLSADGYGAGGADIEYQGDGESSYDERGNPRVGGKHDRNGNLK